MLYIIADLEYDTTKSGRCKWSASAFGCCALGISLWQSDYGAGQVVVVQVLFTQLIQSPQCAHRLPEGSRLPCTAHAQDDDHTAVIRCCYLTQKAHMPSNASTSGSSSIHRAAEGSIAASSSMGSGSYSAEVDTVYREEEDGCGLSLSKTADGRFIVLKSSGRVSEARERLWFALRAKPVMCRITYASRGPCKRDGHQCPQNHACQHTSSTQAAHKQHT